MIRKTTSNDPFDRPIGITEPKLTCQIHVRLLGEPFIEKSQSGVELGHDEAIDNPSDLIVAYSHLKSRCNEKLSCRLDY